MFYIQCKLINFNNKIIQATFFNFTKYHIKTFSLNSSLYIKGKVSKYIDKLQITQPTIINEINMILPKYKSKIKNIEELIKTNITIKNCRKEDLEEDEIKLIIALHFPKKIIDITNINMKILKSLEALNYIRKLRSKKINFPAISSLNGNTKIFIKNLPFQLTNDQQKAIKEIEKDLKNIKKATKRIIIGDVGSGKTIIILASVTIAYPNISILMVPTSILAIQIFNEAKKFLSSDITISILSKKYKDKLYKEAHFIIGTQAVIHKLDLPEAKLIMIDEQHKFGIKQRDKLEKLINKNNKKPHFLQFSATPIPRTQALIDSELIDISILEDIPFQKNIKTIIINKNQFKSLIDKIKAEIKQKKQVIIVYPLVNKSMKIEYQSIEEGRKYWEDRFENIYITYGADKDKENIIESFRNNGDILITTTLIEIGISLPKLTTIVIVGAERLGLATLHQLRGRVGRLGLLSFCYLFTKDIENERLQAFSQINSGFEISKLDLKFRNSGDIINGNKQSGIFFKWLDILKDKDIIENIKKRV